MQNKRCLPEYHWKSCGLYDILYKLCVSLVHAWRTEVSELHQSGEDYLEAILGLEKENGIARSVDVAKRLGVSKPSVSRAMSILKENGYIVIGKINSLELTEKGRERAESVYGRHVLLTKFLEKITGVSKKQAEENACRIEHFIDEDIKAGIQKWMEQNA